MRQKYTVIYIRNNNGIFETVTEETEHCDVMRERDMYHCESSNMATVEHYVGGINTFSFPNNRPGNMYTCEGIPATWVKYATFIKSIDPKKVETVKRNFERAVVEYVEYHVNERLERNKVDLKAISKLKQV